MVTYLFPPWFAGGTRQALELARGLRLQQVDSCFIGANFGRARRYDRIEGFRVYRLKAERGTRKGYFKYAIKVARQLYRLRDRVDLVFLHSTRPFTLVIVLACKLMRLPVLLTMTLLGNDDPVSLRSKSMLWRLELLSLRLVDAIVCKSQALLRACVQQGISRTRLHCIPNGVDYDKFKPVANSGQKSRIRATLNLPIDGFIFTFIGRVSRRKGCDLLLQAWETVCNLHPDAHLLLIGPYEHAFTGELDDTDFVRIVRENFDRRDVRRISFLGNVPHESIPNYLRASDGFVFPSRREGLPNVVIEAMTAGLPVICSRIDGITDELMQDSKEGLVIAQDDAPALVSAMRRLLADRVLRDALARQALKKVCSRFTLHRVALQHASLYASLVSGGTADSRLHTANLKSLPDKNVALHSHKL